MILSIAVVRGQARLFFLENGSRLCSQLYAFTMFLADSSSPGMCFVQHPRGMFLFEALRMHSIIFCNFRKLCLLWKGVSLALATEVTQSKIGRCCEPGTGGNTTLVHISFFLSSTRIRSGLYPFRHLLL